MVIKMKQLSFARSRNASSFNSLWFKLLKRNDPKIILKLFYQATSELAEKPNKWISNLRL